MRIEEQELESIWQIWIKWQSGLENVMYPILIKPQGGAKADNRILFEFCSK